MTRAVLVGAAFGWPALALSQWIGDTALAFLIGWTAAIVAWGVDDFIAERKARRQEGEG